MSFRTSTKINKANIKRSMWQLDAPAQISPDIKVCALSLVPGFPNIKNLSMEDLSKLYLNDNFITSPGILGIGEPVGEFKDIRNHSRKYYITKNIVLDPKFKTVAFISQKHSIINWRTIDTWDIKDRPVFCILMKMNTSVAEPKKLYWFQKPRDYSTEIQNAKSQLSSIVTSSLSNDDKVGEFYRARHNLMQILVAQSYGLRLHLDTGSDFRDIGISKTPDFLEYDEKEEMGLIGDIQVTRKTAYGYVSKRAKYDPIAQDIYRQKMKILVPFYFVCSPSLENIGQLMKTSGLKLLGDLSIYKHWEIHNTVEESLKASIGSIIFSQISAKMFNTEADFSASIGGDSKYDDDWCKSSLEESADFSVMRDWIKKYIEKDGCPYIDKKYDISENERTFREIDAKNLADFKLKTKPSHHIFIPRDSDYQDLSPKYKEQHQIRNFAKAFKGVKDSFCSEILGKLDTILDNKQDFKRFCDGMLLQDEKQEAILKEEYHVLRDAENKKYGKGSKRSQFISFEDFCRKKGLLESMKLPGEDRVEMRKMARVHIHNKESIEFKNKSGVNWLKNHGYKRIYKNRHTCDINLSGNSVNRLLERMSIKINPNGDSVLEELKETGDDTVFFKKSKDKMLETGRSVIAEFTKYYAFKYLKHSSLAYEQILHMSNHSVPTATYSYFTTGLPNMLVCMTGGYRGHNQSSGKSYLYMGYTKHRDDLDDKLYGNLYIEKIGDVYFYRSRWMRLPGHRLEFLKDSFYSVLSSSAASLLRLPKESRTLKENIKGTLSLRAFVALCPSTGFITKLADSRYGILSSISLYTNFPKFIKEKFSGPYHNAAEAWCVYTMWSRLPGFRSELFSSGSLQFRTAKFDDFKMRHHKSIGGKIRCKSIWTKRDMCSIQDLLDEVYLYVHTPKEAVNEFHEEVSAINTIMKFEKIFMGMSKARKDGQIRSEAELIDFLDNHKNVGFCSVFLEKAVTYKLSLIEVDAARITVNVCTELLDKIHSTKAIVPDDRKPVTPNIGQQSTTLSHMDIKFPLLSRAVKGIAEVKGGSIKAKQKNFHGRMKVHDALIALNSAGHTTVYGAALSYLNTGKHVMADICIKAQYGSKREFYVMNTGAKLVARIVEGVYKGFCKSSSNEMISVPGDDKFLHIQRMLDRITVQALDKKQRIIYTNGDCTKWSAAETMESFQMMTYFIKDRIGPIYGTIQQIFDRWRNKRICIPRRVINKVIPLNEKSNFLIEAKEDGYRLKSTQNFLQGVFNYTSSFKIDCIIAYAVHLFNEMYPESGLSNEYLVHSDDYVLCTAVTSNEWFVKFRTLLKVCMRLGGITDSVKKTNCQYVFMEFISLMGFNSSMCYPTIKKTKEISTTLPCEGYLGDSSALCSRTAECMRVGVCHTSSYLFHRLHNISLSKSYSLHIKGNNNMGNRLNTPVSFFGQSDMHPLFYLMSKGDSNNLRLYNAGHYGIIGKLYNCTKRYQRCDDPEDSLSPTFIYNRYTAKINGIRKGCGMDHEEARRFWEEYPEFMYTKPTTPELFGKWLKAMYYLNSFVKAYNKDSRTIRMLRLSMFTSQKCLTLMDFESMISFYETLPTQSSIKTSSWKEKMLTIREYYTKCMSNNDPWTDTQIRFFTLRNNSLAETIYDWSRTVRTEVTFKRYYQSAVATRMPIPPKWLPISVPIGMLFLYIVNEKLFHLQYPHSKMLLALNCEKNYMAQHFPEITGECFSTDPDIRRKAISILHKVLSKTSSPRGITMATTRKSINMVEYMTNHFKRYEDPVHSTNVLGIRMMTSTNPYTGHKVYLTIKSNSATREAQAANKVGLVLAYAIGRQQMDPKLLLDKTLFLQTNGEQINLKDWTLSLDYKQCSLCGMNNRESMAIGFYQNILGSNLILTEMLETGNYFLYKLDSSSEQKGSAGYTGKLLVYIYYRNYMAKMTIHHNENKNTMVTNTPHPMIAASQYIMALTMGGKIPKYKLESELESINMVPYNLEKDPKSTRLFLAYVDGNLVFTRSPLKYRLPIEKVRDRLGRIPTKKMNVTSVGSEIRREKLSIFRGNLKFYTLPYHLYYNTDVFTVDTTNIFDSVVNEWYFSKFLDPYTNFSEIDSGLKWNTFIETSDIADIDMKNQSYTVGSQILTDEEISKVCLSIGILDIEPEISRDPTFESFYDVGPLTGIDGISSFVPLVSRASYSYSRLSSMGSIRENMVDTMLDKNKDMITSRELLLLHVMSESKALKNTMLGAVAQRSLKQCSAPLESINGHRVVFNKGRLTVYKRIAVKKENFRKNMFALVSNGALAFNGDRPDMKWYGMQSQEVLQILLPSKLNDDLRKVVLQSHYTFIKKTTMYLEALSQVMAEYSRDDITAFLSSTVNLFM